MGQQQFVHQRRQRHLLLILQRLHLLHSGQVEQALDQLLHARTLPLDIAGEARPLLSWHVVLQ
ncbi:hypothetical protein D9M73_257140 [compost metagenome]